jgi:plasmid rolling circle replication initiator protein Rep
MSHLESGFEPDSEDTFYLRDVSPRDKPWDIHKLHSCQTGQLYQGTIFDAYSQRITTCGGILEFGFVLNSITGEIKLKLKMAHFCRVRHCSVCQWRRQEMWRARFFAAMPRIRKDYPTARFVFLTLTVRNCELTELRSHLTWMNKSWELLTKRKVFPALGWLKSVEVTRSINDTAHPHFHALLMVPASYFGNAYLSQQKWTELWQACLKVDYLPIVNVKAVKANRFATDDQVSDQLMKALCETLKYSVKPEDLVTNREWLVELTTQLHKTRAVAVGGVFKSYISDEEPEDLIHSDLDEDDSSGSESVWFGWREAVARYYKIQGSK